MDTLKLIYIFGMVLEHGSMNAASAHVGMSASAISQHIRQLEKHYQMKLLNRSTRRLDPTEAGKILWEHARQLMTLHARTEQAMQTLQVEPAGNLRITLPTGYSDTLPVKRAIADLNHHYPKIRLVLIESNRLHDMRAEGIDIAIRAVTQPDDPDVVARPLATWKTLLCAAPTYLEKNPIRHPRELLQAQWLNHSDSVLKNTLAALDLPVMLPETRIDCPNSSLTCRELARAGMGIAVLLSGDIDPFLQDGSLSVVLPQHALPTRTLFAVTAHRIQPAKVRIALDVLTESFSQA